MKVKSQMYCLIYESVVKQFLHVRKVKAQFY